MIPYGFLIIYFFPVDGNYIWVKNGFFLLDFRILYRDNLQGIPVKYNHNKYFSDYLVYVQMDIIYEQ